jgi:Putative esterase.
MKNFSFKLASIILSAMLILTLFPSDIGTTRVYAATGIAYRELWCTFKDDNNSTQYFYMMVPDTQASYPVVFYFTGLGGCSSWASLAKNVKNWVTSGYIQPIAIIMPVFDHSYVESFSGTKGSDEHIKFLQTCKYGGTEDQEYIEGKKLINLIDRLKKGNFTNHLVNDKSTSINDAAQRLDFSRDLTVSGFSMGGACALLAGVKLRSYFPNVGAFSPSQGFYISEEYKWDWIHHASDIIFSDNPNAHLFMSYSIDEGNGEFSAQNNVTKYIKAAEENGSNPNQINSYISVGNHNNQLAMRSLFVYLKYVQNNNVLNDTDDYSLLTKACSKYDHSGLDKGKVTKEPTCTEDGSITYTCSKCKKSKTDVLKATGHSWNSGTVTKAATCTERRPLI